MIILRLEKEYWEKTRRKIRKLEKKNPHSINFNILDRKLATILDKSADILELMDQRFNQRSKKFPVSTLSGNREDSTLRLEIDDEISDYASYEEVAYFYKTSRRISKKMDIIIEAFSYLIERTPLDVGIPFHSTDKPMIKNGTHCKRFNLSLEE